MDVLTQAQRIAIAPTIWFEVEDLVRHFDGGATPAGIPRVSLEIVKAAQKDYSARVRFCRLSRFSRRFEPVSFADLMSLCRSVADDNLPLSGGRLGIALREIRRGCRYLWRVGSAALLDSMRRFVSRGANEEAFRSGDVLVGMGAGWDNAGYGNCVAKAKARYGLRFVTLVHDIIPLSHPQFHIDRSNERFRLWLEQVFRNADLIFTSSEYCRNTVHEYGSREGMQVPPIETIPFGATFAQTQSDVDAPAVEWPERFVLLVATIEIRKNHLLMLNVWRRLIQRHGADCVPALVFLGRMGWRVESLMTELKASNYLDGKIVVAQDMSDVALDKAYRQALFTVFPSFCEGWGMPVSESLARGTFCVCSNATSLPEVGGDFVDYFDPTDEDAAFAAIERAIFDTKYLAARTENVRMQYQPASWENCARHMIERLSSMAVPTAPHSRAP